MSNFRAQFKITIISAVLFHLLLVLAVGFLPARALNENVEMKDFAKNALPGASIIFTEDDVEENTLSKLRPSGFLVSGMPGSDVGSLSLDGKKLSEGSIIPSDEIEKLVFTPAASAEFSAELCLVPLVSLASFDRGSAPITVSLNFSGDLNSPPVAGNYSFETYENMPIYVSLSAFDHDSDRLSYKVVSASGKGTLHIDDANRLVFTPEKDTTGKFELSYYARDSFGNTSAPGQIKIDVNQQKNSMEIADISDPCHSFASVRLAEEGIYSGEQYGSLTVLSPSEGFTRTEFAAVCACALGYNPEVSVFLDTRGVSQWEAPYVADAVAAGVFDGTDIAAPVTGKSAVYTVFSILGKTGKAEFSEDVLTLGLQSGILLSPDLADRELTREEALEIVYRAMETVNGRQFGWRIVIE